MERKSFINMKKVPSHDSYYNGSPKAHKKMTIWHEVGDTV